jgi:hypothetical protein
VASPYHLVHLFVLDDQDAPEGPRNGEIVHLRLGELEPGDIDRRVVELLLLRDAVAKQHLHAGPRLPVLLPRRLDDDIRPERVRDLLRQHEPQPGASGPAWPHLFVLLEELWNLSRCQTCQKVRARHKEATACGPAKQGEPGTALSPGPLSVTLMEQSDPAL